MIGNAFLAVDMSDDVRHRLAASLDTASPGPVVPGKRVVPANWRVTVRFLGPIDDLEVDRVSLELGDAIPVPPGSVRCSGLGAFPRPSKAAVIHVAIDDVSGVLEDVAAHCEAACRDAGLEPAERRFVPHITLARVRPPRDVRKLLESFAEFAVPFRVDAVTLLRTNPTPRGVTYTPLERFPLTS